MQRFGQVARKSFQSSAPHSRWPTDGSWIDRTDKTISGPLLRLQLSLPLEVALSVPGCFFGMPVILSIVPSAVAIAATGSSVLLGNERSLIAIGAGCLLLFSWGLILAGNEALALRFFSMRACVVAPAVGVWLVETNPAFDDVARAQAHLTLVSWFLSLIPTLLIKHFARRRRPVVCGAAELGEATALAADQKRYARQRVWTREPAQCPPSRASARVEEMLRKASLHSSSVLREVFCFLWCTRLLAGCASSPVC